MIEEILSDMRAFFTIVGYTLGTVGFALLLLKYGDDGFESAPAAGLTTYSMALLGDFNIDLFRSFGAFSSCLALRFQKNAPSTPLPRCIRSTAFNPRPRTQLPPILRSLDS